MYNGPSPKSINLNYPDHTYEYITCLITGAHKKKIEKGYLLKLSYTKEKYQKEFPGAPMICLSTLDKYKNPSNEVKNIRSQTMRNLNLSNTEFNEKRIEKMKSYWNKPESEEKRSFYSEKAKKQHQEGILTDSIKNYFKTDYIGSNHQKLLKERMAKNNPWSINEIREKIKNTCIEKYGVDNASKSLIIKEKVINTNNEKYNGHYNQQHFCDKFKNIISSLKYFTDYMDNKSPNTASEELGISPSTIIKYGKQLGYIFKENRSSYEIELEQFLKDQNIKYISNTRSIISPYELDFYLPEYNIAIEINGLYWHSNLFKENNYHTIKYQMCNDKNIRLIMIQGDEWIKSSKLIKSKILNLIGKSEKGLPARKLYIDKISNSVANNFCDKFHIQGKTGQITYACGAFDENLILVGVMIFNQQRNTQDIELIRFCTDGKVHNGLFSKMLKFSIKENNYKKIISFADLRYSEGNLYEKTGFTKVSVVKADYMYIVNGKRIHKSNYSKNSIKKKKLFDDNYIKSHTERELTEELDLPRIYDIGKIKYEIIL